MYPLYDVKENTCFTWLVIDWPMTPWLGKPVSICAGGRQLSCAPEIAASDHLINSDVVTGDEDWSIPWASRMKSGSKTESVGDNYNLLIFLSTSYIKQKIVMKVYVCFNLRIWSKYSWCLKYCNEKMSSMSSQFPGGLVQGYLDLKISLISFSGWINIQDGKIDSGWVKSEWCPQIQAKKNLLSKSHTAAKGSG